MEQHPIPQNISSYQFRLVGDMTLKQFFQLAGGILTGLLFYASPLLPIIKWPFAIVSVLLGIGLAFLPFEERPLEKWIFAFFRAIYSPSLYYWKKTTEPHKFFQDESPAAPGSSVALQDTALQTYLAQDQKRGGVLENLETAEKTFLSNLTNIFSGGQKHQSPAPVAPDVATVRPLMTINTPTDTATSAPSVAPEPKGGLQIPEMTPIRVVADAKPKLVVEEQKPIDYKPTPINAAPVDPVIAGNQVISSRRANFSEEAAPPSPSTYPNVVVGQAVDQDRRIIESAIMEVRDSQSRPIRAIKSNKLGHFITVTPLDNGTYEIFAEKEGYEFSPVSFEATGGIIEPILVSGKNLHPEVL